MIEAVFAWMFHLYGLLNATRELSPFVYGVVFASGVASALSPCYLPVLAMFAGYIGGYARGSKEASLRLALPFIFGNAVTLALAGGLAALLGRSVLQVFTGYQLDRWIPGVIGLMMALQLLGLVRIPLPEALVAVRRPQRPQTALGSLALGLPFGLVVTPCTIPVFVAIVTFVAFQASIVHGALLMVTYAAGRGGVLLAVAVFAELLKRLNLNRTSLAVERTSGALLLVVSVGLLLFYGNFVQFTGQWMTTTTLPATTSVPTTNETTAMPGMTH